LATSWHTLPPSSAGSQLSHFRPFGLQRRQRPSHRTSRPAHAPGLLILFFKTHNSCRRAVLTARLVMAQAGWSSPTSRPGRARHVPRTRSADHLLHLLGDEHAGHQRQYKDNAGNLQQDERAEEQGRHAMKGGGWVRPDAMRHTCCSESSRLRHGAQKPPVCAHTQTTPFQMRASNMEACKPHNDHVAVEHRCLRHPGERPR